MLVSSVTGCTAVEMTLCNVVVTLTCRPLFSLLGRLTQSPESEPPERQPPSKPCPSPATSESARSSVPSESPDILSSLHSSSPSGSPRGGIENLSPVGSLTTMAETKRRAPLPPLRPEHGSQNGGSPAPVREINNPAYVEVDGSQKGKKMSLPLPDYETLFPQKRHGVQGQTRWDHIIAEVNQRHRVVPPEFQGQEMSVDGPEEHRPSVRSPLPQENPALRHHQTQPQETKLVSSKKAAAPAPPKVAARPYPQIVADSSPRPSQNIARQPALQPAVPGPVNADTYTSRESLSVRSRDEARKVTQPLPALRTASQNAPTPDDQRNAQTSVNKDVPRAKPRQRISVNEPLQQEDSAVTPGVSLNSSNQTLSASSMSGVDTKGRWAQENFAEFDPFPSADLFSKDPWTQVKQSQEDDFFTGIVQKEQKLEDHGMTAEDLNNIFSQEKPAVGFNGGEYRKKDEDSQQASPAFQRLRRNETLPSSSHSDNQTSKAQQVPKEETTVNTAHQGLSARTHKNESVTQKHQSDVRSQVNGREDPFGAEPFAVASAWTPSEPLQVVMEEPEAQTEGLSGGKMPLRAWVSPSEIQPVTAQSSNGGGLAFVPRR